VASVNFFRNLVIIVGIAYTVSGEIYICVTG